MRSKIRCDAWIWALAAGDRILKESVHAGTPGRETRSRVIGRDHLTLAVSQPVGEFALAGSQVVDHLLCRGDGL